MKNKLAYSALTDTIFWIDGKGKKTDITQNFIQVVLLWLHDTNNALENKGESFIKELKVSGKTHWEIAITKKTLSK